MNPPISFSGPSVWREDERRTNVCVVVCCLLSVAGLREDNILVGVTGNAGKELEEN
ncbi:hypothetical protein ZHAS_00003664 [Anopheles sinensis]|uniref:Uncharacterized protein n=1 Tax=Anopheles sinensis TaxID=74873 RepID=A0A084VEY3_ANOSI|nr:hypothetical protein ZHAS_00003664 [Anopheles sinensis]